MVAECFRRPFEGLVKYPLGTGSSEAKRHKIEEFRLKLMTLNFLLESAEDLLAAKEALWKSAVNYEYLAFHRCVR